MFVAASTECFIHLPLEQAIGRIVDLEFSCIEMCVKENDGHLKPSLILSDPEAVLETCRNTRRLDIVAYDAEFASEGARFYEEFAALTKLAKATKVVSITVPSGELGTPFNEEVEKLRKLVAIGEMQGVRVSIKSQVGRLSEDPDTVVVLCDNVDGLGVTLDPSHYICGPHHGKSIDKLTKYVCHVHLRDTSKENLQVRVGQGEVEYGRLINQLRKQGYNRALSIHIAETPDVEHAAELRKMRLLLESLL